MTKSYKSVSLRGMESKTLSAVYQADRGWKKTKCKVKVPPLSKLTNYDLPFGDRTLLVLDPYGNEHLSAEMEAAIFGGIPYKSEGWTLAIDKADGKVYRLSYGREGKKFVAVFWEYETGSDETVRIPPSYLDRVDELKCKKRPFGISIQEYAAIAFAEREYGYRDLRMHTVVSFDFRGTQPESGYLEVYGDSHRLVSAWERIEYEGDK